MTLNDWMIDTYSTKLYGYYSIHFS